MKKKLMNSLSKVLWVISRLIISKETKDMYRYS